jgi:hypothetical protein
MGRYLDILRRAEAEPCDKSAKSDKRPPFGRLCSFGRTLQALEQRRPAYVKPADWRQAVADGRRFLATWGEQAEALGWTAHELFGVHTPSGRPTSSYRRPSIYEHTGLVWLLRGRAVVALTAETAAIQTMSGGVLTYRKHNKPALGPIGDSVDGFDGAV